MTSVPKLASLLLPGLHLLGACSSESANSEFLIWDSAEVVVTESRVAEWAPESAWTVEPEPAVRIGAMDGDEEYLLFRVRDGTILSDGRIGILNSGTSELRLYSDTGEHLSTLGGEGDGPAEFRYPSRIFRLPADSMVVSSIDRVTTFTSDGGFVGSGSYGPPSAIGRLSDGRLLGRVWASGVNPYELGLTNPELFLVGMEVGGPGRDTLATVLGDESYREERGGGISSSRRPLGRVRSVVTDGNKIYTGDGAVFEIQVMKEDGTPNQIIRRTADLTLHPEHQARFEEAFLASDLPDALRQRRQQLLLEFPYPEQLPAFDRLLIDDVGNVWARDYVIADESHRWSVFNPTGRWLGVVSMPAGLEVFEIGDEFLVGRTTDAFGVEYVQIHELHK